MSTATVPSQEVKPKEQELGKEINALAVVPFQQIVTEGDYIAGIGILDQLKSKEKAVHLLWDEDIATAHKLHHSLTNKRGKFLTAIKSAQDKIDSMLDGYRKKKAQERLERERKLAEEALKVQQSNLIEEAALLEKQGDSLGAESVLAEAMNTSAPVVVAPSLIPKVAGSYTREVWKFRIKDASKLPREYLIPDEQAIGAIVRAKKKMAERLIPGIEVWDAGKTIIKG